MTAKLYKCSSTISQIKTNDWFSTEQEGCRHILFQFILYLWTGYGRLASNGNMPKSLMQVMVPVVSQSRCKNFYGSSIHDSMICAGLDAGDKDSCQGDSGGPMVCEYNGKYFLEGVVPWGHECADPRKYGVYARVRYLSQWVNQMMNSYWKENHEYKIANGKWQTKRDFIFINFFLSLLSAGRILLISFFVFSWSSRKDGICKKCACADGDVNFMNESHLLLSFEIKYRDNKHHNTVPISQTHSKSTSL